MPESQTGLAHTVLKTLATVAITVVLIVFVREGLALLPELDAVMGGQAGTHLLQLLAGDGQARTQNAVSIGLMLGCFILAVLLVQVLEKWWRRRPR
ncbi:hypothetical protein CSR02_06965 [Acetobacter pomorum]|uniref:Uncharacterized protein n=1 Tax=Acetobacter pomorum TaxID=65959 RepID=A0A2G4RCW7_9PROT|nr:hypothetical protein [Acetobacter pomorum]KDE19415.1 hypothetical protein AZ09_11800 [Acetobacter aceti 1023]PHY94377.1 hypothetical protein CSR02_06965 [Acetobacter pomorum]GBR49286.1 hypothetical protein AA11825_1292 [Acetobacter pomorum DSM 11825]